jgi:hypothetical protein
MEQVLSSVIARDSTEGSEGNDDLEFESRLKGSPDELGRSSKLRVVRGRERAVAVDLKVQLRRSQFLVFLPSPTLILGGNRSARHPNEFWPKNWRMRFYPNKILKVS